MNRTARNPSPRTPIGLFAVSAALALTAVPALAQPTAPPTGDGLPTLDELLGLDDSGAGADDRALQRRLSAREAGEKFEQAVGLMRDAADRIADAGDTSLTTQRVQEDILRKLDQVIEASRQNSPSSGSPSGSQGSPQNQQSRSSQSQHTPSPGSDPEQAQMPGSSRDASLGPAVAPDGVTWGNLPQRERDAVTQGVSDRYSALYRRLTELYYRRLADEEREP